MERVDVAIVGAGLLGCFTARALARLDVRTLVLEAREDACTGISRANTGIVYTGLDTRPGTLKTRLCLRANRTFGGLCRELDVPFRRCGSLLVACGPRGEAVIRQKYRNGSMNGVPGLRLLAREALLRREPGLGDGVTAGLYAPGTGVADPWALCIAAYENARENGVEFRFSQPVRRLARQQDGFVLETPAGQCAARAVVNCAGLDAGHVRELVERPHIRIFPTAADYLVLDQGADRWLRHVIFHEPEEGGKGLTLAPTTAGNVLVGPTERPWDGRRDFATDREALEALHRLCAQVFPGLPLQETIRSFGALRPNPCHVRPDGERYTRAQRGVHGFTVLEEQGLVSLIGIKTPGMTCAAQLGEYVAERVAVHLGGPPENPRFSPVRRGIPSLRDMPLAQRRALIARQPAYGRILCRCREITEGEAVEAIRRGAVTLDGIKRRTGATTGRCQGSHCTQALLALLARERGLPVACIQKDGPGSALLRGGGDGAL